MVETNQISRAYRYLEVREKIKGQLSEILMIVRNFIRDFRAVITKYDIGDRAESLKDAEDLFEKHPRNLSLTMLNLRPTLLASKRLMVLLQQLLWKA